LEVLTAKTAGFCFGVERAVLEAQEAAKEADGIVWISAVYWSDMTECFKAFFDRLRRCDATRNHFLAEKRCVLIACAGGTGRGTLECMTQMERLYMSLELQKNTLLLHSK
jgi:multimeric flavodoxin WrbA